MFPPYNTVPSYNTMPLVIRGNILQSRGRVDWLPDGNATQPALTFSTDPDTGLYRPGNDQIALSTGGTDRFLVDANGTRLTGTAPSAVVAASGTWQYAGGTVKLLNNATEATRRGATLGTFIRDGDGTDSYFAIDSVGNTESYHSTLARYDLSDDRWSFNTNNTERLTIESDGNVTMTSNLNVTGFITGQGLAADLAISNVQICDSSWTPLDDTALPPEGGKFLANGIGFAPGILCKVGGVNATATSYINSSQLRVEVGARASGSYDLMVIRGDTKTATLPSSVSYSNVVTWITGSTLGNVLYGQAFTIQLQATSDSNVTYSNVTTLPTQTTLNTATGNLTGNIISVATDTLFSFDVDAIDEELQDARRSFLLQYIGVPPVLATTDQTIALLPGTYFYFMIGGGAGGGSGNYASGSAGYIVSGTFVLSTAETVTITIGQGGVGGASGTSPGANGGNTSITIPGVGTYTANGATRSLISDPYVQRGSSGGAGSEDFNQSTMSGTAGYGGRGGFGRGSNGGTTTQNGGAAAGMGTTAFTTVMNSIVYKPSYNYNFRAGTTTQRVSGTAAWGGSGAAGVICDIVSYPSATSATLPYISDTPSTGFGAGGGAGATTTDTVYGPGGNGAPGVAYLCVV